MGRDRGDTTFVLVHGFLDLAFGWHEVAERLAARAHVIAPDLRGHGDSDWIGAGGYYHFLDYVADLDDVIARLARKRLVVVGHSMGGSVASYWAGTRPDRLARARAARRPRPARSERRRAAGRTAQWIDAWRPRAARHKPMPSLDDAAARLRKHDPLLAEALALKLAAAGTRAGRRRPRVEARSAAPDDGPLPVPPRRRRAVLAAHHVPGARRRRRARRC